MKKLLRVCLQRLGFSLVQIHQNPAYTFLGIGNRNIDIVIDIGANVGQFARQMRTLFPAAAVHSFEPLNAPFIELKRWATTQNGFVVAHNFALGNREELMMFHAHVNHTPSSSLLSASDLTHQKWPDTREKTETEVQVKLLDSVFVELGLSYNSDILIKIDVQGYEDRVLSGGRYTLSQCRFCIVEVGLDELYEEQAGFYNICEYMIDAGLSYIGNLDQHHHTDGHALYADLVFAKL